VSRAAFAWASYDWANSAFPTVVSTFVIAAYFAQGIAPDPATGQAWWGWMQAAVGLAVGLASPLLGAIADRRGARRAFLGLATLFTALATAGIWFAEPDPRFALFALLCVGAASVGFELGPVFYNALLPQVAPAGRMGRLSGLAWGLGYAGGLVCLALALLLLVGPDPSPFGLDRERAEHVRAVALLVAGWILAFGWPVLLFVRDAPPAAGRPSWGAAAREGLRELAAILRRLPASPALLRFHLARLFYTDGLNMLFAFGAIFAAGAFGMGVAEILLFGIALNITAGVGSAAFALVEDRFGSRNVVLVSLAALVLLGGVLLLVESAGGIEGGVLGAGLAAWAVPRAVAGGLAHADGAYGPGGGDGGAVRPVRPVGADHRFPRPGSAGGGDGGNRQPTCRDGGDPGLPGGGPCRAGHCAGGARPRRRRRIKRPKRRRGADSPRPWA
jgi:UMF1 family MFS transporter